MYARVLCTSLRLQLLLSRVLKSVHFHFRTCVSACLLDKKKNDEGESFDRNVGFPWEDVYFISVLFVNCIVFAYSLNIF